MGSVTRRAVEAASSVSMVGSGRSATSASSSRPITTGGGPVSMRRSGSSRTAAAASSRASGWPRANALARAA